MITREAFAIELYKTSSAEEEIEQLKKAEKNVPKKTYYKLVWVLTTGFALSLMLAIITTIAEYNLLGIF